MTFDCIACGFTGKDKYALDRHNETKKHLDNVGRSITDDDDEILDIRKMDEKEASKYIINHKWFIKADPAMAAYRNKLKEFGEVHNKLENNIKIRTPSEKQKLVQQIKDEYRDVDTDEDEDEDIQNERLRRIASLDYNLPEEEVDRLVLQREQIQWYLYEHTKEGCHFRHVALKEKIRDKMINHLNAKDKLKRLDEVKEQENFNKLERQKMELELKIKLLELKMKK